MYGIYILYLLYCIFQLLVLLHAVLLSTMRFNLINIIVNFFLIFFNVTFHNRATKKFICHVLIVPYLSRAFQYHNTVVSNTQLLNYTFNKPMILLINY